MRSIVVCGLLMTAVLAGSSYRTCSAAPPNDDWANRTVVGALPFSDTLTGVDQATSESSDPELFCIVLGLATAGANSVWYEYTTGAADEFVKLTASGYDTIIGVYEGTPEDGFAIARGGCNDDGAGSASASIIQGLRLGANTRYSIVIARYPPNAAPTMTLAFAMSPSPVYQVSKEEDSNDGVCDADCSVREAVQQSVAQPGAVLVPPGHYLVAGGLSLGTKGGAMYGSGMSGTVLDANGTARVLSHGAFLVNSTYGLHDLTLTNGHAVSGKGGAFLGVGGTYVFDHVALTHSIANGEGGGAFVEETSTMQIYDSLFSGNRAQSNGGGLTCAADNVEIHESTFANNESLAVGANTGGGGLYTYSRNEVRLFNVTVSGNLAAADGGGAYITLGSTVQKTIIDNSDFVDNEFAAAAVVGHRGGLVLDRQFTSTRSTTIANSVLSGNHVQGIAGVFHDCGSIGAFTATTGHDAVQAPNGCTFSAAGDQTGMDPMLLPLAATGASLPVHMPAPDSPLIDSGDPATCSTIDALGQLRPFDGDGDGNAICDIGAVERELGDTIFASGFD